MVHVSQCVSQNGAVDFGDKQVVVRIMDNRLEGLLVTRSLRNIVSKIDGESDELGDIGDVCSADVGSHEGILPYFGCPEIFNVSIRFPTPSK